MSRVFLAFVFLLASFLGSPSRADVAFSSDGIRALDIARGRVAGQSWVNKFGRNSAVGGTAEVIWTAGGDYTGFLLAGSQLENLSSDIDDAAGDTGARSITLEGLDDNLNFQTETIVTNGTSAVASAELDWFRVNRAFVATTGTRSATTPTTTGGNEGVITVRVEGGGAVVAVIEQEVGQTEMAVFTVPAGFTAYVRRIIVSVSATINRTANVIFWQRQGADETSAPFSARRMADRFEDVSGEETQPVDFSVIFPEKTDVWWSAVLSGSGADAAVVVDFEMLLVQN